METIKNGIFDGGLKTRGWTINLCDGIFKPCFVYQLIQTAVQGGLLTDHQFPQKTSSLS